VSRFHRVRRARRVIRRPADAWLFARMVAWAALLPLVKRRVSLVRLVEAAAPARHNPTTASADTVIALSRWVYRLPLLRDNCLEKSLLTYRYLPPDGGGRYRLVLGFRGTESDAPPGHAWLTVDDVPVHDTDATLMDLVPVLAFDGTGRREDLARSERPVAAGAPGSDEGGAKPE
jgi:Transglutaminase-like superfamily